MSTRRRDSKTTLWSAPTPEQAACLALAGGPGGWHQAEPNPAMVIPARLVDTIKLDDRSAPDGFASVTCQQTLIPPATSGAQGASISRGRPLPKSRNHRPLADMRQFDAPSGIQCRARFFPAAPVSETRTGNVGQANVRVRCLKDEGKERMLHCCPFGECVLD